jgi:hypothetical protein
VKEVKENIELFRVVLNKVLNLPSKRVPCIHELEFSIYDGEKVFTREFPSVGSQLDFLLIMFIVYEF